MSKPSKQPYRKRRLFPRTLQEVVKDATKPLMDKQGKLYGALLRDWSTIVGAERAKICKPERLQFPTQDGVGAVLHLQVRPAAAPELAYSTEQILEQCARYFGYRAIDRIVIHAAHGMFDDEVIIDKKPQKPAQTTTLPGNLPKEMRGVLERMANHFASASDKKD